MNEQEEIIALSEINAILKDFKRVNEYEEAFDILVDKLTAIINDKAHRIEMEAEKAKVAYEMMRKEKEELLRENKALKGMKELKVNKDVHFHDAVKYSLGADFNNISTD